MKKRIRWIVKTFLITMGVGAGAFGLAVVWPLDVPAAVIRADKTLIRNVALVDLESGRLLEHQSILIDGGIIAQVAPAASVTGATVVDASGLFAIPGMFDMHVHTIKMSPALTHPLFVAAGVTAVRDMGGCLGLHDAWAACANDKRAWSNAVAEGRMVGPRFDQITSLPINGGSEVPDGVDQALGAATAEGARLRVAYDHARGIDFLKTYSLLPREGYFTLAEEAPRQGLYLAGHVPFAVSASEAVAAGQRSLEHAFVFIWDCYEGMDALRATGDPTRVFTNEVREQMIAGHDAAQCAALRKGMAEGGTAYVPTHTTRKLDAFALDASFRKDPRLRYIPGPLKMMWLQDADATADRAGAGGAASYRAIYDFGIQLTGRAHAAGVTVMLGTDAPDSFAFPGLGVLDEFEHFTQAGLSPLDALRTATLAPARFLGLEGRAGVIKAGARADIVLLRSNPLLDIQAVRDVDSVVLAGAVYDRVALDSMLALVEDNAGSWMMWPKFAWQILNSPIMRKQFAD